MGDKRLESLGDEGVGERGSEREGCVAVTGYVLCCAHWGGPGWGWVGGGAAIKCLLVAEERRGGGGVREDG